MHGITSRVLSYCGPFPAALLRCLILLQHLCLASFPFTGNLLRCVGNIIITWPQQKKKHTKYNKNANSKTNETEPFFSFSAEFIQLAPPAEISSAFLSRQPPWPANFCVDNYSQQKKSILYIKKKKEKRNQVRATTSPAESTALQLMDATVATVLLDNPPLKEAQKIMLK